MDFKLAKKLTLIYFIAATLFLTKNTYAASCSTYRDCPNYTACVKGVCENVATVCSLEPIFATFITTTGVLVGFAFFLMLIFGGVRYLLSGGDPKAVAAAKGTLTWAIGGLAFFALSFTILMLVETFTGVSVTTFKICQ